MLTTTIATLTGATVRALPDGTAEVLVGGNALVSGDKSYAVAVTGTGAMAGAAGDPVKLSWTTRPGVPLTLDGGEIAGAVSTLAAANASGTGGALAEAANDFNGFAQEIADKVNAIHKTAYLADGVTTGLDFFAVKPTGPAALGLSVIPTDASEIATAAAGAGGKDGSVAAKIAQLATGPGSPDKSWSAIVTGIGIATKTGLQQSKLADLSTKSAIDNQLANSSVDIDEENVNMLSFQTAYQAAARVMTSVDEMLDTLINRTGIVGR
jgi:flagellar hook-associated protein 1 FlgK